MPHLRSLTLPDADPRFLDTLARLAREEFGKAAPEGSVLAAAVQRTSLRYTRMRGDMDATHGEPAALTARLRYFLPRDLFKVWGPLAELSVMNALPQQESPRLLDLGAGLGTTSLGVGSFLHAHQRCQKVHVVALDADAIALKLCKRLLQAPDGLPSAPFQVTTANRCLTLDGPLPAGPFHLITVGFALNELLHGMPEAEQVRAGAAWLTRLCTLLTDDGAVIVLEPALREPARTLQAIRDRMVEQATNGGPRIFAPCLGTRPCPLLARPRDWCHERLPLRFPAPLAELAREAGLREETITYSYLTLRNHAGSLASLAAADARPYRVVGGPVASKGKVEYALCGVHDAPALIQLTRDRKHADDATDALRRSTVISLQQDGGAADARPRLRLTQESRLQLLLHWTKRDGSLDKG